MQVDHCQFLGLWTCIHGTESILSRNITAQGSRGRLRSLSSGHGLVFVMEHIEWGPLSY